MATKSKVVSWLGVLLGIISELYKLVVKRGGSDENFHFLATAEGEAVREQIADLIRWASAEFGDKSFTVKVDRGRTLQQLLNHHLICEAEEGLRTIEWYPRPGQLVDDIRVVLFPMSEFSEKHDWLIARELRRRGYRPAQLDEVVSLPEHRIATFASGEFRNKRFILALGTKVPSDSPDEATYPVLYVSATAFKLLANSWSKMPHPDATWIAAVSDRK
jgi:hypothetical protein